MTRPRTDLLRPRSADQARIEEFFDFTVGELRETIEFLISHRERLRDEQLARLERESELLIGRIDRLEKQKLLAELDCFREVLSLQKRLIEEDARPRD